MSRVFEILTLIFGIGLGVGICGFLLAVVFDWDDAAEFLIRLTVVGLCGALPCLILALLTAPPSPLSRGLVSDKQERDYTLMVMVGKMFVPQHHHDWLLVSSEGATCNVGPTAYNNYHVGDAVVCAWRP